jgi:hypothetical protein
LLALLATALALLSLLALLATALALLSLLALPVISSLLALLSP